VITVQQLRGHQYRAGGAKPLRINPEEKELFVKSNGRLFAKTQRDAKESRRAVLCGTLLN